MQTKITVQLFIILIALSVVTVIAGFPTACNRVEHTPALKKATVPPVPATSTRQSMFIGRTTYFKPVFGMAPSYRFEIGVAVIQPLVGETGYKSIKLYIGSLARTFGLPDGEPFAGQTYLFRLGKEIRAEYKGPVEVWKLVGKGP